MIKEDIEGNKLKWKNKKLPKKRMIRIRKKIDFIKEKCV